VDAIPPYRQLERNGRERLPETEASEDFAVCRVLVVGSGDACGTPKLACLLQADGTCKVCADAKKLGSSSRNARLPPSLLIEIKGVDKESPLVLLVDCGQALKRQILMGYQRLGTKHVDGVLLTTGDGHKYVGVNDLREVQHANGNDSRRGDGRSIRVFGSASALEAVEGGFPFLFRKKDEVQGESKTLVAGLAACEVPATGGYLDFQHPVPVRSLVAEDEVGYVIGSDDACVAVLPSAAMCAAGSVGRATLSDWHVEMLVIGGVAGDAELSAALDLVRAVSPGRAVLTGLGCGLLHSDAVARVGKAGLRNVDIAYDEMCAESFVALRSSTCGYSTSSSTTPGVGSSDRDSCGPDLPGVEHSRFELEA
jgi:hypothetical protein